MSIEPARWFAGLCEILRQHSFVGMAEAGLGLLQHQTQLYLADLSRLSYDLFYQQVHPPHLRMRGSGFGVYSVIIS